MIDLLSYYKDKRYCVEGFDVQRLFPDASFMTSAKYKDSGDSWPNTDQLDDRDDTASHQSAQPDAKYA